MKWSLKGFLEANYSFTQNKSELEGLPKAINKVSVFEVPDSCEPMLKEQIELVRCVHYARDLGNMNAFECTPSYLAEEAKRLAKEGKCKATVLCRDECEKKGLHLFCAVGAGSEESCASKLITVEYDGNPGSKSRTCFVGKGVTYDTGGLTLKLTSGMMTMRGDMCGAGAVLALLKAVVALRPSVNIVFVIPTTENVVAAKSFKPGDVYRGFSGKTVEITNTDAEGRLILADAVAYAEKTFSPSCIVDIATLTGAAIITFGYEYAAVVSEDESLVEKAIRAGLSSGEYTWQLPYNEDYKAYLKSSVADMSNAGPRGAGTITAGVFIQNHIKETKFLHIDMAAVDNMPTPKLYHGNSTFSGFGPILLWELLQIIDE
jgi:leucyl aminopeptidase